MVTLQTPNGVLAALGLQPNLSFTVWSFHTSLALSLCRTSLKILVPLRRRFCRFRTVVGTAPDSFPF